MGEFGPNSTSQDEPIDDLTVIHRERDPGVARLLEAFLLEQDIPCRIVERLQTRGGIASIDPYPLLLHELLVYRRHAESAAHLIHRIFEDHETGPDQAHPASDDPNSPPERA